MAVELPRYDLVRRALCLERTQSALLRCGHVSYEPVDTDAAFRALLNDCQRLAELVRFSEGCDVGLLVSGLIGFSLAIIAPLGVQSRSHSDSDSLARPLAAGSIG